MMNVVLRYRSSVIVVPKAVGGFMPRKIKSFDKKYGM